MRVVLTAALLLNGVLCGSWIALGRRAGQTGLRRGAPACSLPGHTSYPFCNTSLSIDERVRDLVRCSLSFSYCDGLHLDEMICSTDHGDLNCGAVVCRLAGSSLRTNQTC